MEKLPKETEREYKLFLSWINLDDRNLLNFSLRNKTTPAKIGAICKKNKWESRAEKYDNEMMDHFNKAKKEALSHLAQDIVKEQVQIKKVSSKLILEGLTKYLVKMLSDKKFNLRVQDIEKINNILKNINSSEEDIDESSNVSNMSDEDLQKISELLNK